MFLAKRHTASEQQRLLPDASLRPSDSKPKRLEAGGDSGRMWVAGDALLPSLAKQRGGGGGGRTAVFMQNTPPSTLTPQSPRKRGRTRLVAWERGPSHFLLARHGTPPQSP